MSTDSPFFTEDYRLASDLQVLEAYQGVLGLTWGTDLDGQAVQRVEKSKSVSPPPALLQQARCRGNQEQNRWKQKDPLNSDPWFLYEAVMLYGVARNVSIESNLPVSFEGVRQSAEIGRNLRIKAANYRQDIGVSLVSVKGAKRLEGEKVFQVYYQQIGNFWYDDKGGAKLEIATTRPIRWPGDVYSKPVDIEDLELGDGEYCSAEGQSLSGWVIVAIVALALFIQPLLTLVSKLFKKPPPCIAHKPMVCNSLPETGREEHMEVIETQLNKMTDRQMDILKSVEVDLQALQIRSMIGSGSFSLVYKVSNQWRGKSGGLGKYMTKKILLWTENHFL